MWTWLKRSVVPACASSGAETFPADEGGAPSDAGADSAAVAQAMDQLGNVTVLERPMRVASLVSAVRATRQVVIPLWGDHLALDASTTSMILRKRSCVMFTPAMLLNTSIARWLPVPLPADA